MVDLRKDIGAKVRDLRKARHWTQAELAQRLDLSQARLSQIERGNGSFAAEHLLEIFRLFNVDASHFTPAKSRTSREDQLWNAAARLGASHLVESDLVLPSERLQEVHDVLREALVTAGSPRLITGLASVLVTRADALQLPRVEDQLAQLGLQHRLGWLVENTLEALRQLGSHAAPKAALRYRRAQVILSSWLRAQRPAREAGREDVIDQDIRSEKSRARVLQQRTAISARWGVLSELSPKDFAAAIEAASEKS
jgi:transcriptional regulator with XRE-family HTH domain